MNDGPKIKGNPLKIAAGLLVISGVLSVPISAVLISKYFDKSKMTVWYLTLAFAIWSVVLTILSYYVKTGEFF